MTKKKKKKIYKNYHEWLYEELQNPEFAIAYLNEALMDEDQKVFLIALKDILEAQKKDMSQLAKKTDISRQNLYRMLSKKGNPRWDSLASLFNALGYQIQISIKN